jgi:hypothetical protein
MRLRSMTEVELRSPKEVGLRWLVKEAWGTWRAKAWASERLRWLW